MRSISYTSVCSAWYGLMGYGEIQPPPGHAIENGGDICSSYYHTLSRLMLRINNVDIIQVQLCEVKWHGARSDMRCSMQFAHIFRYFVLHRIHSHIDVGVWRFCYDSEIRPIRVVMISCASLDTHDIMIWVSLGHLFILEKYHLCGNLMYLDLGHPRKRWRM